MHSDADPLSQTQERQANMFASAFLMPAPDITRDLVRRAPTQRDWPSVLAARARWGISAKALLYRSRELGALTEAAFRRSMQNYMRSGMQHHDGVALGEPEQPIMLQRAVEALGISEEAIAAMTSLPLSQVAEVISGNGEAG
jgi:Zn-dependent peptidase ImmA (M78 family)